MQETLKHAANNFFKKNDLFPDVIIYLSLHTIRKKVSYIDQALNTIIIKDYDSIISVNEEKDPVFLYDPLSLKLINKSRFDGISKSMEKVFKFNGAFVAVKFNTLMSRNLFSDNIGHVEILEDDIMEIKDFSLFKKKA